MCIKHHVFFHPFLSAKSAAKDGEKWVKTLILDFPFYTIISCSFSMHFTVSLYLKKVVKKVLHFSPQFFPSNVYEILVFPLKQKPPHYFHIFYLIF
jgi:hypothetical protein